MARYKPVERGVMLMPVMLHEQTQPGTFEFALDHLIDHELDLSDLDARFNNDEVSSGKAPRQRRADARRLLWGSDRPLFK
jgi:hypothetical protein